MAAKGQKSRQASIYAIGLRRGSRVHFLATRETNFRRACKTLRDLLKGNKRYTMGSVGRVAFNRDGTEKDIKTLYTASTKRAAR